MERNQFFNSIKRNRLPTFANSETKASVKNSKEIHVEKEVIGTLLAKASKQGKVVDI